VLTSISKKAGVSLVPKKRDGTPQHPEPRHCAKGKAGLICSPEGNDRAVVHASRTYTSSMEIKEWQALMEHLKMLPKKNDKGVSILVIDEHAEENRAINLRA
jgi:5'-nucleotidase